jgi:hypothetical protein
MLVNQETPRLGAACSACARPLGASYLRHASMQARYCDYDCYRQQASMGIFWPYRSSLEAITMLTAISAWSLTMQMSALSRSLTDVYLRAHDLLTTEGGDG